MIKESIGARIARMRNKLSLSQEDLEISSKVPRRTIQNIEYDKGSPRLDNFIAICEALNLPIEIAVYGEVSRPPKTAADLTPEELVAHMTKAMQPKQANPKIEELIDLANRAPDRVLDTALKVLRVSVNVASEKNQVRSARRK